jgi:hypothetical protein
MPNENGDVPAILTRRHLGMVLGLGTVGTILTACTSMPSPPPAAKTGNASKATDFSARFANFQPADEPNGDPAKVTWPEFVIKADPEVKQLYTFQITHGELMRWMPCFCGCGQSAGHRNNRDCYVQAVNTDGSVAFDDMAPT